METPDGPQTETLILAAENTLRQMALRVVVGDLFLTSAGLYYVPYWSFLSAGGLGGAAAAIGGLAGGIAVGLGDRQSMQDALSKALEKRTAQWGLSLRDRFPGGDADLFVPRSDIASLEAGKNRTLLARLRSGQCVELVVPASIDHRAAMLAAYARGDTNVRAASPNPSRYGLNLPYPAPIRLLGLLDCGQQVDPEMLRQVSKNDAYLDRLYSVMTMQKKDAIIRACSGISRLDSSIARRLAELSRVEIRSQWKLKQNRILFLCAGFFVAFAAVLDANAASHLADSDPLWLACGNAMFLGTAAASVVTALWRPKARIILRSLSRPSA